MQYPQPIKTEVIPVHESQPSKTQVIPVCERPWRRPREWVIIREWKGRDHMACRRCPECKAAPGDEPATYVCSVLSRRKVRGTAARDFMVRKKLGEAPLAIVGGDQGGK